MQCYKSKKLWLWRDINAQSNWQINATAFTWPASVGLSLCPVTSTIALALENPESWSLLKARQKSASHCRYLWRLEPAIWCCAPCSASPQMWRQMNCSSEENTAICLGRMVSFGTALTGDASVIAGSSGVCPDLIGQQFIWRSRRWNLQWEFQQTFPALSFAAFPLSSWLESEWDRETDSPPPPTQ